MALPSNEVRLMSSQPLSVARCLDTLLRYELAAVRGYLSAEWALPAAAEREALATVRRSHELAAAALRQHVAVLGQPPSAGPGLWGVFGALVEASVARSGRRAVLTVLLWSERHGIETYGAACRIPGLPAASRILIESALLPDLHGHVRELEHLIARPDGEPAKPAVAARSA
jgi:hypothetical protein